MLSIRPVAFASQIPQSSHFSTPTAHQAPVADTLTLSPRFSGETKDNEGEGGNYGFSPLMILGMKKLGVDVKDMVAFLTAPPDQQAELFNKIIKKSPKYADELGIDPTAENPYKNLTAKQMSGEQIQNPKMVLGIRTRGLDPKTEILTAMTRVYLNKYGSDAETEQIKRLTTLITDHILPAIETRLDDDQPVPLHTIQTLLALPSIPQPSVNPNPVALAFNQGEYSAGFKPLLEMPTPPKLTPFHKAINEATLLPEAISILQSNKPQQQEEVPQAEQLEKSIKTLTAVNKATLMVLAQVEGEQIKETIDAFSQVAQTLGIANDDDAHIDALCEKTNTEVIQALKALIYPLLEENLDLTIKNITIDGEIWPFITDIKSLE